MADKLVEIGEGFWNVRGSFKIGGLVDIGTQCSLARLASGGFVFLDAYSLTGEVRRAVLEMTDQGRAVEAILNLHPFHTVHVERAAAQFPHARLYGTARHHQKCPALRWEPQLCEGEELHQLFAQDFVFSVPRGVDFIPDNENLHFASVLALHRASGALHVDDTLTWTSLPLVGGLSLHPTLRWVLQKRPGAVSDFRAWSQELVELCGQARFLCTAHSKPLPPDSAQGASLQSRVRGAVEGVQKVLDAHQRRYG
jgi:hypothetical protein